MLLFTEMLAVGVTFGLTVMVIIPDVPEGLQVPLDVTRRETVLELEMLEEV